MDTPTIYLQAPADEMSHYNAMGWKAPGQLCEASPASHAYAPFPEDNILDGAHLISHFQTLSTSEISHKTSHALALFTGANLSAHDYLMPPEHQFFHSPGTEVSTSPFSSPASTAGHSVTLSPNSATVDVDGQEYEHGLYSLTLGHSSSFHDEPHAPLSASLSPIITHLADFPLDDLTSDIPIFRNAPTSHVGATCAPQDIWAEDTFNLEQVQTSTLPSFEDDAEFAFHASETEGVHRQHRQVEDFAAVISPALSTLSISPSQENFHLAPHSRDHGFCHFLHPSSSTPGSVDSPSSQSSNEPSPITPTFPTGMFRLPQQHLANMVCNPTCNASTPVVRKSTGRLASGAVLRNYAVGASADLHPSADWGTIRNCTEQAFVGAVKAAKAKVASDKTIKASMGRRRKEGAFKCNQCQQTFTARHNLNNHMNSHNKIKPFACEACGREFGTKSVQQRHAKSLSCPGNTRAPTHRAQASRRRRRFHPIEVD